MCSTATRISGVGKGEGRTNNEGKRVFVMCVIVVATVLGREI